MKEKTKAIIKFWLTAVLSAGALYVWILFMTIGLKIVGE